MSAASSRRKLLARRFAETMAFGTVGAMTLGLAGMPAGWLSGAIVGVSLDDGSEVVRHAMPNPVPAGAAPYAGATPDAGNLADAGADAGDAGPDFLGQALPHQIGRDMNRLGSGMLIQALGADDEIPPVFDTDIHSQRHQEEDWPVLLVQLLTERVEAI